jgi:hypothetical protein
MPGRGGRGVGVSVGVAVSVGLDVGEGVSVAVGELVAVAVAVAVAVGVVGCWAEARGPNVRLRLSAIAVLVAIFSNGASGDGVQAGDFSFMVMVFSSAAATGEIGGSPNTLPPSDLRNKPRVTRGQVASRVVEV